MRIAFLLTQSLESPSGLGRFGPLARELVTIGHQVEVYALHHDLPRLPNRVTVDRGVRVMYVGQMHVRKRDSLKTYFSSSELLRLSITAAASLTVALARSPAEIVHLCKPQPANSIAARLGSLGRPVFCDCDDYEAETNRFSASWQRPLVRYFEDGVKGYARGLTVNTQFTRDRYAQLGFSPSRIVYVPNGVEPERFRDVQDPIFLRSRLGIAASDPIVVYVGTISRLSHAVDLLLQSFEQVVKRLPSARLLLVGGGEDYQRVQQQVATSMLRSNVGLVGRIDPADVASYYSLGTVSVDPVEDNLIARARSPLKIVESLTCGTPVVTGDIGDRRVMLNGGETGVLVRPGDSSALAEGLVEILRDSAARARMSEAARARRDEWAWDRLVNRFASIYVTEPATRCVW